MSPFDLHPDRTGGRAVAPGYKVLPLGVYSAIVVTGGLSPSRSGDTFTYVQISDHLRTAGSTSGPERADVPGSAAPLIDSREAVDLAELFRLLGDPTRVRILFALLQAGELCVGDIAAVADTGVTKVSQAMRLLRGAGVVRNRREGRNVFYRLDDAHVRLLLDVSREHLAHIPGGRDGR